MDGEGTCEKTRFASSREAEEAKRRRMESARSATERRPWRSRRQWRCRPARTSSRRALSCKRCSKLCCNAHAHITCRHLHKPLCSPKPHGNQRTISDMSVSYSPLLSGLPAGSFSFRAFRCSSFSSAVVEENLVVK